MVDVEEENPSCCGRKGWGCLVAGFSGQMTFGDYGMAFSVGKPARGELKGES